MALMGLLEPLDLMEAQVQRGLLASELREQPGLKAHKGLVLERYIILTHLHLQVSLDIMR
jgi:hypothetical protein